MRILHIIDSLQVGGAESLLCNSIKELLEHEHLVITVFKNNNLGMLPGNARHVSLNVGTKAGVILKGTAYLKIIKAFQPHLAHAHLYFATILAKACTPKRIPLLFTQHFEFSKNAGKWYYKFTDRLVSGRQHTCVAVSQTVLNDYISSTNFRGKTKVLGIYIPDNYFGIVPAAIKSFNGDLKVVALGNIKPIKNQQYLLDAFSNMRDMPVTCDVYGEGAARSDLLKVANDKGIKVDFKGPINSAADILSNYHLYIMPSRTEGFPLALFEAMAASLPPLVSDIPVFRELLGINAEYFSLSEPKTLRPLIECYLQQPELLHSKGEKAKTIAFQKASREKYLQQLRVIYTEAIT